MVRFCSHLTQIPSFQSGSLYISILMCMKAHGTSQKSSPLENMENNLPGVSHTLRYIELYSACDIHLNIHENSF